MNIGRPRKVLPPRDLSGFKHQYESVLLSEILFDSEFNCRGEFTYESVGGLAEQIESAGGLIYPVIVWPREGLPPGKKYQLVAGHRRFRAYELLKQERIPAIIREGLTQREAELINLMENVQRNDLNFLQSAIAIRKRFPHESLREIARQLNMSVRWVQDRMHLLELPGEVQNMIAANRVAARFIPKLRKVARKSHEKCVELAKELEHLAGDASNQRAYAIGVRKTPFKRPTQRDIIRILTTMLDSSVIGLTPRFAAYTQGWISEEEFIKDLKRRVPKWAIRAAEEACTPSTSHD